MPPHFRTMTEKIYFLCLLNLFNQKDAKGGNFYFKLLRRERYVFWIDIIKSVF